MQAASRRRVRRRVAGDGHVEEGQAPIRRAVVNAAAVVCRRVARDGAVANDCWFVQKKPAAGADRRRVAGDGRTDDGQAAGGILVDAAPVGGCIAVMMAPPSSALVLPSNVLWVMFRTWPPLADSAPPEPVLNEFELAVALP